MAKRKIQALVAGPVTGPVIGVDLGGTNVRAGLVKAGRSAGQLAGLEKRPIRAQGTEKEVLEDLFAVIDPLFSRGVKGIGIGVPSLVDKEKGGVILDTVNIPSWKKVALRKILEKRYRVPVRIDNDANCFALAEARFGAGRGCDNFVGLILGTGVGAGIIANGRLVSGAFCGAGEFGTIPYRDGILENYASGQFFRRFGRDGAEVAALAAKGDPEAARLFGELGVHIGHAVQLVLYALAPERIVLGGSVGGALPLYREALGEALRAFAFPKVAEQLELRVSKLKWPGVLGAAGLVMEER